MECRPAPIRSNCVDIVLAPEAIGECLAAYVASELPASEFAARNSMGDDQSDVLEALSTQTEQAVGVSLTNFRPGKVFSSGSEGLE